MVSLTATLKNEILLALQRTAHPAHKQPLSCLLNILRLDDLSIESFTVS